MNSEEKLKIEEIADQVIKAAKTALELTVSYEQRLGAYEFLEKIKDDTSLAVPCGFLLSGCDKEPQIRHLGLQLLEDTIRYHWNDISVEKKVFIKENSMLLLSSGTQDILLEPMYIKDKVSRLIVEMMKREWPQQWSELLPELERIANIGATQAELVLLIFLRIAEDVATLQNLESNQRRRDLYQALNQNMDSILGFFFTLLEEHYTKYRKDTSADNNMKHCRITQVVFSTLTCFVEWISIHYLQNYHIKFFNSMCQLISDQNIRQNAVECLLQIISRKGKLEERRFILSLFSEDVMKSISNAANLALIDPLNEQNYLFLKELTQVVTTLGGQLSSIWGKDSCVKEPQCFPLYLNTLLAFSKHPSLVIYSYTNFLWIQFFKNEVMRKNIHLINAIPKWLPIAFSKVMRHGFPSKNDSMSCQYSKLDFDSDDEYYIFFCKVRSETCDTMKFATQTSPDLLFVFAEEHFMKCLQQQPTTSEALPCLQNDWDALSHVVERIMSQVFQEEKDFKVPKERAMLLLQQCLHYQTSNPEILSLVLTCISGLSVLLPFFPELHRDVLQRLFECISFTGGHSRETRTKAIKNARKHAASLLLRLCRTFPQIFLVAFEDIDRRIMSLISQRSADLSQLERVTLIQSLLILNSQTKNYDVQHEYIGKVIGSLKEDWLNLKDAFSSSSALMAHIGLSSPPSDSREADLFGVNRSQIVGCVDVILALLQRCRIPAEAAVNGGFVLRCAENGAFIYRNPATPHILTLFPNIFCFLRAYNGLYLPDSMLRLPVEYAKVHTTPDEKISLLGKRTPVDTSPEQPEVAKTPFQRMQLFLKTVYEHMCLILGYCGPNLMFEFYQYPHLAECLIHSIFWNFTLLPNLKMRYVIRILKPFIEACPPEFYEPIILPLVNHVFPMMMSELNSRWENLSKEKNSDNSDGDIVDTDKLVEDMMLHDTSRDYLEVLNVLLIEKASSPENAKSSQFSEANGQLEVEMETDETDARQHVLQQENISQLGRLALRCNPICQAIVLTLLRALSWPDTVSCRRAIQPLLLCVQEMVEEGHQYVNGEAVKQIFLGVLRGIHIHGQHSADLDALSDLAVSLYEKLRPYFVILSEVLLSLPDVNIKLFNEFEDSLHKVPDASAKKATKHNKFKREAFKKVIRNIIGRSVGETLKKDAQFSDLHPIFRQRRREQPRLDEASDDLSLCNLFGVPVVE